MAHIFIATPLAGSVTPECYVSVSRTAAALAEKGIKVSVGIRQGYDVATQRDWLAHDFLKKDATHILFVDSDMGFHRDVAGHLLSLDKDMVAVAYTQRRLDMRRMKAAIEAGKSFDRSYKEAHNFAMWDLLRQEGGLLVVGNVGLGFVLIKRCVFDLLAPKCRRYRPGNTPPVEEMLTGFFDRTPQDDTDLSEDFSFCTRYRAAGGEIWLEPRVGIEHIGPCSFGYPMAEILK